MNTAKKERMFYIELAVRMMMVTGFCVKAVCLTFSDFAIAVTGAANISMMTKSVIFGKTSIFAKGVFVDRAKGG